MLIEGSYLVRTDSPLQTNEEVDRTGHRVVVGQGSAYDLFLSREIRHATLLRAPSSPEVVGHFLAEGAEVAAGVRAHFSDAEAIEITLDVMRNGINKIAVALGGDAPRVSEGTERYLLGADGQPVFS